MKTVETIMSHKDYLRLNPDFTGILQCAGSTSYIAYALRGELHREGEPAIITSDGEFAWFLNGLRHREDGPAVMWLSGNLPDGWWLDGCYYATKAQYDHALINYRMERIIDENS
jgi:hypothetical protein